MSTLTSVTRVLPTWATNLLGRGSYLGESYALSGEGPARLEHVVGAGVGVCLPCQRIVGNPAAGRALRQDGIFHGDGTCGSVSVRGLRGDASGVAPVRSRRTGSGDQPL